jgi:hypothetical protein
MAEVKKNFGDAWTLTTRRCSRRITTSIGGVRISCRKRRCEAGT